MFSSAEVENTVPKMMRANPFAEVNNMLGPGGERWVPVHGTVPFSEATKMWQACEAVFATLDAAQEDLQRGRGRAAGRIRLGATVEFGCSVLMRHIQPFLDAHPGIEMDFHLSADLLTPLQREDIDLAIDCMEHPLPELERTPLFREAYMVACAPAYRAAHAILQPGMIGDNRQPGFG